MNTARNEKMKVGISSCLLGERVRYNAGHKLEQSLVRTMGKYFCWVPVCPEVEAGMGVPREAVHSPSSGFDQVPVYNARGEVKGRFSQCA